MSARQGPVSGRRKHALWRAAGRFLRYLQPVTTSKYEAKTQLKLIVAASYARSLHKTYEKACACRWPPKAAAGDLSQSISTRLSA